MPSSDSETTNRLLRVMIALLLRLQNEGNASLKQQIGILSDLGLEPAEIAKIVNRAGTYVNKELSVLRKSRRIENA